MDHTQTVALRAKFAGLTLFKIGLGCYLWLVIASILRLRHREPRSTARRVLLPYAIVNLLMNLTFAIFVFVDEERLPANIDGVSSSDLLPILPTTKWETVKNVMKILLMMTDYALIMYRTGVLFSWKRLPMIIPSCIYLAFAVTGILFCIPSNYVSEGNGFILFNLAMALELALNIILTFMITVKLVMARRVALAMGAHMKGLASQYLTTIHIVADSAVILDLAIIFHIASFNSWGGKDLQSIFPALLPFFTHLVEIASALSPALLLYRIVHDMQYTPPAAIENSPRLAEKSQSQWLYDPEQPIVSMDKGKGRALDTDSDTCIGASHETSMGYLITIRHDVATSDVESSAVLHHCRSQSIANLC